VSFASLRRSRVRVAPHLLAKMAVRPVPPLPDTKPPDGAAPSSCQATASVLVRRDINEFIHANDEVPCVFAEMDEETGERSLLFIDQHVRGDEETCAVWCNAIREAYAIRHVEPLLLYAVVRDDAQGDKWTSLERAFGLYECDLNPLTGTPNTGRESYVVCRTNHLVTWDTGKRQWLQYGHESVDQRWRLFTLRGESVSFSSLKQSRIHVDSRLLTSAAAKASRSAEIPGADSGVSNPTASAAQE
jgi:hypothetical protein